MTFRDEHGNVQLARVLHAMMDCANLRAREDASAILVGMRPQWISYLHEHFNSSSVPDAVLQDAVWHLFLMPSTDTARFCGDTEDEAYAWCYRVLSNSVTDWLQRTKRKRERPEESDRPPDGSGVEEAVLSEWEAVVGELRASAAPRQERAMVRFQALALEYGKRVLSTFRQLDDAAREDVINDLLAKSLESIVRADRPRSYFRRCVCNGACDLLPARKRDRPVDGAVLDTIASGSAGDAPDSDFVMDARRALAGVSERDRRILTAVGLGQDRDELACELNLTRGAIDQIVSRARRRFHGEDV